MKLEIGDVVSMDGGLAIVREVKADKASIIPMSDFKGRSSHALKNGIEANVSNNRVIERRGAAGLAEFLAEAKEGAKHKGAIKTEPGDRLCYEGALCTVTAVTADKCSISHPDGRVLEDDRWLNEFFFRDCECHELKRLTAAERAENLKVFSERQVETKAKEPSAKTEEKPKTKSSKQTTINTNIQGRLEFVASLVAEGGKEAAMITAIREKYPVTTASYAKLLIEGRRKKAKAAK